MVNHQNMVNVQYISRVAKLQLPSREAFSNLLACIGAIMSRRTRQYKEAALRAGSSPFWGADDLLLLSTWGDY